MCKYSVQSKVRTCVGYVLQKGWMITGWFSSPRRGGRKGHWGSSRYTGGSFPTLAHGSCGGICFTTCRNTNLGRVDDGAEMGRREVESVWMMIRIDQ